MGNVIIYLNFVLYSFIYYDFATKSVDALTECIFEKYNLNITINYNNINQSDYLSKPNIK